MIRSGDPREGGRGNRVRTDASVTYVVVGVAEGRMTSVGALRAAGLACHAVEPEQVLRLEPIAPCGLEGWRAQLRGSDQQRYAGVVLVNPPARLPWLDPGLLDWESGRPGLVAGILAPGLANLYLLGLGSSSVQREGVDLLVTLIRTQTRLNHPLVDELMRFVPPNHETPAGRTGRRLERKLRRRIEAAGTGSWWEAARELDGPLTAARGT
jgi:hypothetical protein